MQSASTYSPVPSRLSTLLTVRIMAAGKCNDFLTSKNIRLPCPCERGIYPVYLDKSKQVSQHDLCEQCGHTLEMHGDFEIPSEGSPSGSDLVEEKQHVGTTGVSKVTPKVPNPNICPRQDTVSAFADLIKSNLVTHVRGTPASGKTTLAYLIRDRLIEDGWNVFFMRTWGAYLHEFASNDYDNAWDVLELKLKARYQNQNPAAFSAPNSLLLVDEAQASYKDDIFWSEIIKEQLHGIQKRDMRICLVCSYGSPTTGVEPGSFTPAEFTSSQRITITPQSIPGSPQFGLFFTRLEFEDAVSRKVKNQYHDNFTLHEEAGDYIFSFTNGHPGAVEGILSYIYECYRSPITHEELPVVTKQHVISCLKEEEEVWTYLGRCSIARSFPKGPRLTPEAANVLEDIAEQGNIEWDKKNEGICQCFVEGWIHKTIVLDATAPLGKEVAVLPSRLHEKWVERNLSHKPAALPSEFDTLQELCIQALRRFSVTSLRNSSTGKKMSSAAKYRAVEAQYQDEFYKAFKSITGRAVPICSEWSRTQDGRVDFYIPEKKWAIEFLRDHRKIDEHISRFHKGGAYYGWIQDGIIREWIVIDCATTLRTKVYTEPNLIHAIFLADYTELQVFGRRRLPLHKARLQN